MESFVVALQRRFFEVGQRSLYDREENGVKREGPKRYQRFELGKLQEKEGLGKVQVQVGEWSHKK